MTATQGPEARLPRSLAPGPWPLIRYWLPVLAWMGLILTLSGRSELAIGTNPATGETVKSGFALAKLGHVVEYAVLALLLFRASTAGDGGLRLPPRRAAVWVAVAALAFGAGDELRQSLVPNRSPRLADVLLDGTTAAVTAAILAFRRHGRMTGRTTGWMTAVIRGERRAARS